MPSESRSARPTRPHASAGGRRLSPRPSSRPSPTGRTAASSRSTSWPPSRSSVASNAPSHHRAGAAVDVDGDTGDEGAGVGAQEAGHAGELLGLAHAADRDAALGHALEELLVALAAALRLVAARPLVALDQPDQHGVDHDV